MGVFGIGKRESNVHALSHTHARTHARTHIHREREKKSHMHCNCPCYSGALSCIVRLWSRINGGRGIRVNLLGTHGPGFVSKPHFGFVEENGNDMGAKQEKESFLKEKKSFFFFQILFRLSLDVIHFLFV